MCGIAGVISQDPPSETTIARMSEAIAHRGPDDLGHWQGAGATLIHRRLSILDLAGGRQPMASEDGSLVVCFNGEIYNYPALRRRLSDAGRRFRTRCDTEVLLHLYAEHGPGMVDHLKGMFAFALWDAGRGRLLLARDHLGQKPLYYRHEGGELLFASEMKGLFRSGRVEPEIDLDAVWHYTALRFCPGDTTLFRGVRKLPPGHRLLFTPRDGTLRIDRYWAPRYADKVTLSLPESVEALDGLLDRTVDEHLLSDVPVGAFLSGGVDSSVVASFAARHTKDTLQTFTIGVSDSDFSELPFAREAAERIGSEHREFVVEARLMTLLPDIVWHLEEPADPHAVGVFLTSRAARQHVKVALGGDGGDEVFGGYTRYTQSPWFRLYDAIPAVLRRHLLQPIVHRLPESFSYYSLASKARWVHENSFLEGAARHYHKMSFFRFPDRSRAQLFSEPARKQVEDPDTLRWIAQHYDSPAAEEPIDRMLHAEAMTRLPEHYLLISDRLSMAHGLELRVPLVDREVFDFAAALPPEHKIRPRELKLVLREVAKRHYPASFVDRTKQGFGFPMARWFRDPLRGFIRAALERSTMLETGLFDAAYVEQLLSEHQSGRVDHNFRLWSLLNFEVWHRLFLLGQSREQVRGWITGLLTEHGAGSHASPVPSGRSECAGTHAGHEAVVEAHQMKGSTC